MNTELKARVQKENLHKENLRLVSCKMNCPK